LSNIQDVNLIEKEIHEELISVMKNHVNKEENSGSFKDIGVGVGMHAGV
jgi:hypothetical protein